jgi:hypothetical protein
MAIDIKHEHLITIDQAALMLPGRDGGAVHAMTVGRWTRPPGLRGVVLESLLCGPRRCTSLEGLQRFLDRVTEKLASAAPVETARTRDAAKRRTRSQTARAVKDAIAECKAAGA